MVLLPVDAVDVSDPNEQTPEAMERFRTISNGLEIVTREPTQKELTRLRSLMGDYEEGRNYNQLVDGMGTGLRPPTDEEWELFAPTIRKVESMGQKDGAWINKTVDLTQSIYFPPIGSQYSEGSCVAWACAYYARTYSEAKERGWNLSGCQWFGGHSGAPNSSYWDKLMSPDFVYHQINNGVDGGAWYGDAMDLMHDVGACSWKEMPYSWTDHTGWPDEPAWREAAKYRTKTGFNYWDLDPPSDPNGFDSLRNWLNAGNIAVISVNGNLYSQTDSNDLWKNDTYNPSGTNHANTIVGFNDTFGPYTENGETRYGAFKVANSWLKGWTGDRDSDGCYWISYESMKWDVNWACYFDEWVDYNPELLAVFNISHNDRKNCKLTFGAGDHGSPDVTKVFTSDASPWPGAKPYPDNKMALDITEFKDTLPTFYNTNFFMKVRDGTSTAGTIEHFSVEHYKDYENGTLWYNATSEDPVCATVQNTNVYCDLMFQDDLKPWFVSDLTPATATTGENLEFRVVPGDDIGIRNATLEYWTASTGPFNVTMTPSYAAWKYRISVPHSLEPFNYRFHIGDLAGKWNVSQQGTVTVLDNDLPLLFADVTGNSTTTGELFTFTVNATDNIEIEQVNVQHWTDLGSSTNTTLTHLENSTYQGQITAPDTLDLMNYIMWVNDTSGNLNFLPGHLINISDNDAPLFGSDNTPEEVIYGGVIPISVEVTDNIEVESVIAEVVYNATNIQNLTMVNTVGNIWSCSVDVVQMEPIDYIFHAVDTSDNWAHSVEMDVDIFDGGLPVFGADLTPDIGYTGDVLTFNISVLDDVGVAEVVVEYTQGTRATKNMSLSGNGPYTLDIIVGDSLEPLEYVFKAADGAGNWNSTPGKSIEVFDNDAPEIDYQATYEATTGDIFTITIDATDNIGVDKAWVSLMMGTPVPYRYDAVDGVVEIEMPHKVGEFSYWIFANDTSGNSNNTFRKTGHLIDNDAPVAEAGTYTNITEGIKFNLDASGSSDNIGIETYSWKITSGDDEITSTSAPYIVNLPAGTWIAELTVTDAAGLSDTDTTTIEVAKPIPDEPEPPVNDTEPDDEPTDDDEPDDDVEPTDDDVEPTDDDIEPGDDDDDDTIGTGSGTRSAMSWLVPIIIIIVIVAVVGILVLVFMRNRDRAVEEELARPEEEQEVPEELEEEIEEEVPEEMEEDDPFEDLTGEEDLGSQQDDIEGLSDEEAGVDPIEDLDDPDQDDEPETDPALEDEAEPGLDDMDDDPDIDDLPDL